jgi:hypothetical protein
MHLYILFANLNQESGVFNQFSGNPMISLAGDPWESEAEHKGDKSERHVRPPKNQITQKPNETNAKIYKPS